MKLIFRGETDFRLVLTVSPRMSFSPSASFAFQRLHLYRSTHYFHRQEIMFRFLIQLVAVVAVTQAINRTNFEQRLTAIFDWWGSDSNDVELGRRLFSQIHSTSMPGYEAWYESQALATFVNMENHPGALFFWRDDSNVLLAKTVSTYAKDTGCMTTDQRIVMMRVDDQGMIVNAEVHSTQDLAKHFAAVASKDENCHFPKVNSPVTRAEAGLLSAQFHTWVDARAKGDHAAVAELFASSWTNNGMPMSSATLRAMLDVCSPSSSSYTHDEIYVNRHRNLVKHSFQFVLQTGPCHGELFRATRFDSFIWNDRGQVVKLDTYPLSDGSAFERLGRCCSPSDHREL
eukprot:TRINITY_DN12499_c1_g1_i2.p2 TRINITY_DN12499_c1_g1~~TRINITY_DN12499_c1_g1_i2.p2  ORF type:complete len:344 (+),score=57.29 TRINITY_DN12499_c1_g1_i2:3030-4061(+)